MNDITIMVREIHFDHWMEPRNVTAAREPGEKFCEICGTDLPWHTIKCRLLKQAYRNRKEKCGWCAEEYIVGDDMYSHTTTQHAAELKADYGVIVK